MIITNAVKYDRITGMKPFVYYLATLVALVVLDGLWLGVVAKSFYKEHLGALFRADFVWLAIVAFYILYAAAIVYFVVLPAEGLWVKALLGGILLGFTTYMTYDLVNYATLKDWPLAVVLADIAWGCVVTGAAATVATLAGGL